jgi:ABC-type dipeptide/oligopeptide/nickel transport system permease component
MSVESAKGPAIDGTTLPAVSQEDLELGATDANVRPPDSTRRGTVRYLAGRLGQGVFVLWGAVTLSFLLVHVTGNPATVLAGGILPPAQLRAMSARLGYNRPIIDQYASYLGHVVQGNFGDSFRYGTSAIASVMAALPNTLILIGVSLSVAISLSIWIAVSSVLNRRGWSERFWRPAVLLFQGVPDFWIALILVWVLAVELRALPSLGFNGASSLILPCTALAIPMLASFTRLLRARLLEFVNSDVALALQARGLTRREIVLHHGLRNAMTTFVPYVALQSGWLIGGTLIIETIFAWPGIGSLLLSAVLARDLTVVQAVVVVIALAFTVLNLIADLVMLWLDPRISRSGAVR